MRMEQFQIEENQRNVRRAMAPRSPRLFRAIWAKGWPRGEEMIERGSGPMQNAMAMITAQPVKVAVTREETMAKGTALAALDASSAMVAEDSKPETTQTGVRKESMNAQPLQEAPWLVVACSVLSQDEGWESILIWPKSCILEVREYKTGSVLQLARRACCKGYDGG
jgi:hypothetical protein